MSANQDQCPECGQAVQPDDRICAHCGTWLRTVDAWPEVPWKAEIPEDEPAQDSAAEPVPLVITTNPMAERIERIRLGAIAAITLVLVAGWRYAEVQIVDRDPWEHWDLVWILFAIGSVAAGIFWLRLFLRRRHHHRHHQSD